MSIESATRVSAVRSPPPVRAVEKVAVRPAASSTQGPDVVTISARAKEAFAASHKGGGDADHDGD